MKITRKQHKQGLQEVKDGLLNVEGLVTINFSNVMLPNKQITTKPIARLHPDAKLVRNKHGKGATANLKSQKNALSSSGK